MFWWLVRHRTFQYLLPAKYLFPCGGQPFCTIGIQCIQTSSGAIMELDLTVCWSEVVCVDTAWCCNPTRIGISGHKLGLDMDMMSEATLIARFVGPTWGPSGADRTQVGPMLAPWTLLSGNVWRFTDPWGNSTFQAFENFKRQIVTQNLLGFYVLLCQLYSQCGSCSNKIYQLHMCNAFMFNKHQTTTWMMNYCLQNPSKQQVYIFKTSHIFLQDVFTNSAWCLGLYSALYMLDSIYDFVRSRADSSLINNAVLVLHVDMIASDLCDFMGLSYLLSGDI